MWVIYGCMNHSIIPGGGRKSSPKTNSGRRSVKYGALALSIWNRVPFICRIVKNLWLSPPMKAAVLTLSPKQFPDLHVEERRIINFVWVGVGMCYSLHILQQQPFSSSTYKQRLIRIPMLVGQKRQIACILGPCGLMNKSQNHILQI